MWIYDRASLRVLTVNDAALAALGYAREELMSLTLDGLIPGARIESGPVTAVMRRILRRDGTFADVELCASVALEYAGRPACLALFRDLADPVTRLPTRAALFERATGEPSIVLLVRVRWAPRSTQRSDDSRRRAIRAAADAIGRVVPGHATLVRYAEDTFAIRLRGGRTPNALALAAHVQSAFERPLVAGCAEISGTPTIGISAVGSDPAAQLRDAEAALEHAAATGAAVQLFDATIAARHDRYAIIERNLRHAVVDGRATVVFQPIVSLRTSTVVGAEALLRWDCPGLGPLAPTEFIAIAEESRVILGLGEWVLREACAENRRWQLAGLSPVRVTVNVSAQQIVHPDFLRVVGGILESTSLAAAHLEIELTGPALTSREDLACRTVAALHRLGVRIAIDEVGTGYSSLRDLGALHIDTLKLARPFVRQLGSDRFATEAARGAVRLAHLRGIRVVAVGVENVAQLDALRAIECDEAQGFLFGAPVAGEMFATGSAVKLPLRHPPARRTQA